MCIFSSTTGNSIRDQRSPSLLFLLEKKKTFLFIQEKHSAVLLRLTQFMTFLLIILILLSVQKLSPQKILSVITGFDEKIKNKISSYHCNNNTAEHVFRIFFLFLTSALLDNLCVLILFFTKMPCTCHMGSYRGCRLFQKRRRDFTKGFT